MYTKYFMTLCDKSNKLSFTGILFTVIYVTNIIFCLVVINLKLSDIQYFVQRRKARKREDNNDTFTYTYKKKTNDIFIMQIVAYFFIFIERFT